MSLGPGPVETLSDIDVEALGNYLEGNGPAPAPVTKPVEKGVYGPRVKACHLAIGVDLLGSKTSLASGKNASLEMTSIGIRAFSKNTGRTVIIPYSNVKGFELMPGE